MTISNKSSLIKIILQFLFCKVIYTHTYMRKEKAQKSPTFQGTGIERGESMFKNKVPKYRQLKYHCFPRAGLFPARIKIRQERKEKERGERERELEIGH